MSDGITETPPTNGPPVAIGVIGGSPADESFSYTGVIQTYTVAVSGIYAITADGAQGGGGFAGVTGGAGAQISADLTLVAGTVLDILVGGGGADGTDGAGGGGGGGSFVVEAAKPVRGSSAVPLVIAGGGGGAGGGTPSTEEDGAPGATGMQGGTGGGDEGGAGGSDGGGGVGGDPNDGGGGGGGYSTAGDAGSAAGGASFLSGGANAYFGGYGGGGAGGVLADTGRMAPMGGEIEVPGDGGGGGGYSGGGGGGSDQYFTAELPSSATGRPGGGGGSYIAPAAVVVVGGGGGIIQTATADALPLAIGRNPVTGSDGAVSIELLCFLAGTRIATPAGPIAVEALRAGDAVLTAAGRPAALRWIGCRAVDAASPIERELHYPVRVRRDAVAPGVPARDLLVTGDHALWIDGRLIPARLLVNGVSIVAERAMVDFTYFHLELDRHDLLLAEGLACESYLDTGNRHMFSSVTVMPAMRADAASVYAARGVAPLALAADLVEPVWRRLAARAGVAAPACVAAPGEGAVDLLAGGVRLRPICAASGRLLFALPAGVSEAVIASDTMRPSERQPWLDDRRRLGVAVRRIRVQAGGESRDIALDAPALADGWHGVERTRATALRWTAGEAALRLPAGARLLELTVARRLAAAIAHSCLVFRGLG